MSGAGFWRATAVTVGCAFLGACAVPTIPVEVGTAEPIKVEVEMRVDLYQHKDPNEKTAGSSGEEPALAAAKSRSRNRIGEIQILKNNQHIGENRRGFLSVLKQPTEPNYASYVEKIVAQENADRAVRMQAEAAKRKMTIEQVQTESATLNYHNAFSGEWVEADTDKDGTFVWDRKP